ncbi:hypothetical protein GXW82_05840 [Streptacidiphilus sp. 4-A2]|nr:hypothetical protein [Streptacidiphilus sp. 4-A2]
MKDHPSDAAHLDSLGWVEGQCEVCRRTDRAVAVHADAWLCREDLRWLLHFNRCENSGAAA